jgi:hypothetical protein
VISIFNDRFSVPFVVRMGNQEDVILRDEAPSINFDFLQDIDDRSSQRTSIDEDTLTRILSNGEKRALYILNIIFEVEARKTANLKTLFIVDDIADSFDYRNKYAIVEYLAEISNEPNFFQLILSHNFDFYRTISGRLNLKRSSRILASREASGITFQTEVYQRSNPFSHWRDNFDNPQMLVASIAFLRNMSEFSGDEVSYKSLTSLLHVKQDTGTITLLDLQEIIRKVLADKGSLVLENPTSKVEDLIHAVADSIAASTVESASLEEKISISIAIRLKAEKFMITKISDSPFVSSITKNQTIELIKKYRENFPAERKEIALMNQVNLMTPENIHLNSFMYEPILDLSAQHLKKIYKAVSAL